MDDEQSLYLWCIKGLPCSSAKPRPAPALTSAWSRTIGRAIEFANASYSTSVAKICSLPIWTRWFGCSKPTIRHLGGWGWGNSPPPKPGPGDPSRQRACLGRLVGGLLRLQRGREPLAGAVEGVAAGESQLRATEVVVPDPRRPSAGERAHRKRALLPPPRSVQSAAGLGFLRPDLDVLRRPRAGGAGTLRLQPGQQTPSSPDSARGGDDGGLADGPPCLCR